MPLSFHSSASSFEITAFWVKMTISTLKIKAAHSFKTSISIDQTTRRQIPNDSDPSIQINLREDLQSPIFPKLPPVSVNLSCLLENAFSIHV
jgi:hypothetical protein